MPSPSRSSGSARARIALAGTASISRREPAAELRVSSRERRHLGVREPGNGRIEDVAVDRRLREEVAAGEERDGGDYQSGDGGSRHRCSGPGKGDTHLSTGRRQV
jgi:hypothetical protein